MPRPLKVYRTPIGFHDAYVAATSQKAALQAWGADVDLFARGAAEQVTDAAQMAEALAAPGTVIRKVRGTMDEHLAALPPTPVPMPRPTQAPSGGKALPRTLNAERKPKPKPKPKPRPRPSRASLDAAEQAIGAAEQRYDETRRALADREAALRQERQALEAAFADERDRLKRARDEADAEYRRAMAAWRDAPH